MKLYSGKLNESNRAMGKKLTGATSSNILDKKYDYSSIDNFSKSPDKKK